MAYRLSTWQCVIRKLAEASALRDCRHFGQRTVDVRRRNDFDDACHGHHTRTALVMTALPYIPSDIIKCIFAAFLGVKINTVLQKD